MRYRKTNGRLALSQASQRRLFFERQLTKEKDDLEDSEVELKKTEEQSGLIAPTGQTETEIRTIAEDSGGDRIAAGAGAGGAARLRNGAEPGGDPAA